MGKKGFFSIGILLFIFLFAVFGVVSALEIYLGWDLGLETPFSLITFGVVAVCFYTSIMASARDAPDAVDFVAKD